MISEGIRPGPGSWSRDWSPACDGVALGAAADTRTAATKFTTTVTAIALAMAIGPATDRDGAGVDGQPEGEEEEGGEGVTEREHEVSNPGATVVSATTSPAMNTPIASDTRSSSAIPATTTATRRTRR